MPALMIDTAGAIDRDDAIAVERTDFGFKVTVLVACVADHVPIGSYTDRQAATRGASAYLPGRTIAMLGRDVEEIATLTSDADRSALRIDFVVARDGRVNNPRLSRADVPAGECVALDHMQVLEGLRSPDSTHHETLAAGYEAARALAAHRRSAGSFVLYDTARGLVSTEDGALLGLADPQQAAAYLLVQEMMIATNCVIAEWAIARELPIVFRNHRRSIVAPQDSDRLTDAAAALSDPLVAVEALQERVNLTIAPATYDATVLGHYGLQVRGYTHATSPLRRYADLVTQRIVLAAMAGQSSPYSAHTVAEIATGLTELAQKAREKKQETHTLKRRRETAAAVVSGDLSNLDDRGWLRVLRMAGPSKPPTAVTAELRRRLQESRLHGGHIAQIMISDPVAWESLRTEVLAVSRQRAAHLAASVLSSWQNLLGHDTHAPHWQEAFSGPAHRPQFAVRAILDDQWISDWHTDTTKKAAQQQALWDLLDIIAGRRTSANLSASAPLAGPEEDGTGDDASVGEPGCEELAATTGATVLDLPEQDPVYPPPVLTMIGMTALQRQKRRAGALSNPVAWLNTLSEAVGEDRPVIEESVDGPPHSPQFTVTITAGPARGSASAALKRTAKTSAALAAVQNLFNAAPAVRSESSELGLNRT